MSRMPAAQRGVPEGGAAAAEGEAAVLKHAARAARALLARIDASDA
ncbi:hypothetical protein [Oceanicola sp. 502str15]|nr:hypothetical protein [Oceanicola sp. 502str15]MCO6384661.1 hypothetical protein [Oceanicola sp. 502str15]